MKPVSVTDKNVFDWLVFFSVIFGVAVSAIFVYNTVSVAGAGTVNTAEEMFEDSIEDAILTELQTTVTEYTGDGGDKFSSCIRKEIAGNVIAGIDIVGYRNMYEQNGEYYISDIDDIIIDTYAENVVSGAITKSISYWDNGNGTVTAELVTTADQRAKFYDIEKLPKVTEGIEQTTLNVTVNNNTFNPKTIFYVRPSMDAVKVCYVYQGNTTWHMLRTGTIRETPKGVEYLHLEPINIWRKAEGIGTAGGYYTIPRALTPYEIAKIKVTAYTINGDRVTLYPQHIVINNEDLTDAVSPVAFAFVGIISTFFIGTYINWRVLGWRP